MSSHKETRQHWMETELWNFAHALALDLAMPETAEDSIYRSMKAVIEIASGLAGCGSAKESAEAKCPNCLSPRKEERRCQYCATNTRHIPAGGDCAVCQHPWHEESAEPEEWISIDRRLPETTGEYYCCFVTHMGTQKHCAILKFRSGYFWGADSQTREVTHWFSLPKPPEHAQKGK